MAHRRLHSPPSSGRDSNGSLRPSPSPSLVVGFFLCNQPCGEAYSIARVGIGSSTGSSGAPSRRPQPPMKALRHPWSYADPACVEAFVRGSREDLRRDGPAARLSSRRSLIRQVYEGDPPCLCDGRQVVCARCGGTTKVIAVIEPACADLLARGAQASTADRRQTVVRPILAHLGLPTGAASLRAPPDQTKGLAGDPPREWSSEPVLDDLPGPDPASV